MTAPRSFSYPLGRIGRISGHKYVHMILTTVKRGLENNELLAY
jgi:hypothetical protein